MCGGAMPRHALLWKLVWLAVDEIVHHDDVVRIVVIRTGSNVARRDAHSRDPGIVKGLKGQDPLIFIPGGAKTVNRNARSQH